jgi:hypothetical protein
MYLTLRLNSKYLITRTQIHLQLTYSKHITDITINVHIFQYYCGWVYNMVHFIY